jgi:hypothetical protein
MIRKFETSFQEFIKEIVGQRIPSANAPGERRADYIAYVVFGELG